MFEVGRLCLKLAGRDAGKQCVVVQVVDATHVLIDGETRRRKVNISHLEPLEKTIEIKQEATHEDVVQVFKQVGLKPRTTKSKQAKPKPVRIRKVKAKHVPKKSAKPTVNKSTRVESQPNELSEVAPKESQQKPPQTPKLEKLKETTS
jgi:large subunit ribosomal protein L14e